VTEMTGIAQKIATEFVAAWTAKDVEAALRLLADDVVCEAPSGRFEGVAGYRGFIEPFAAMITGASVVDVLGDDTHAVTVYTTDTPFLQDFRGIDYVTVADGKITHILCVFDRLPMTQARADAQS